MSGRRARHRMISSTATRGSSSSSFGSRAHRLWPQRQPPLRRTTAGCRPLRCCCAGAGLPPSIASNAALAQLRGTASTISSRDREGATTSNAWLRPWLPFFKFAPRRRGASGKLAQGSVTSAGDTSFRNALLRCRGLSSTCVAFTVGAAPRDHRFLFGARASQASRETTTTGRRARRRRRQRRVGGRFLWSTLNLPPVTTHAAQCHLLAGVPPDTTARETKAGTKNNAPLGIKRRV